jgi:hypothetical protein
LATAASEASARAAIDAVAFADFVTADEKKVPVDLDRLILFDSQVTETIIDADGDPAVVKLWPAKHISWQVLRDFLTNWLDYATRTLYNKTLNSPIVRDLYTTEGALGLKIFADSANSREYFGIRASTNNAILQAFGNAANVNADFRVKGTGRFLWSTLAPAGPYAVTFVAQGGQAADPVDFEITPKLSGRLTVGGRPAAVVVAVPASATSTGVVGQIAQDDNFLYVCVNTNTWRRTPISTW